MLIDKLEFKNALPSIQAELLRKAESIVSNYEYRLRDVRLQLNETQKQLRTATARAAQYQNLATNINDAEIELLCRLSDSFAYHDTSLHVGLHRHFEFTLDDGVKRYTRYPNVRFNLEQQTVSMDVTPHDVPWDAPMCEICNFPMDAETSSVFPHVYHGGRVCFGDYEDLIIPALVQWKLGTALAYIIAYLEGGVNENSSAVNPYQFPALVKGKAVQVLKPNPHSTHEICVHCDGCVDCGACLRCDDCELHTCECDGCEDHLRCSYCGVCDDCEGCRCSHARKYDHEQCDNCDGCLDCMECRCCSDCEFYPCRCDWCRYCDEETCECERCPECDAREEDCVCDPPPVNPELVQTEETNGHNDRPTGNGEDVPPVGRS